MSPTRPTLTHPTPASDRFPTQYGTITAHEWCELEARRINRDGLKVEVVLCERGRVALARVAAQDGAR
jgi:hypothetical protein